MGSEVRFCFVIALEDFLPKAGIIPPQVSLSVSNPSRMVTRHHRFCPHFTTGSVIAYLLHVINQAGIFYHPGRPSSTVEIAPARQLYTVIVALPVWYNEGLFLE